MDNLVKIIYDLQKIADSTINKKNIDDSKGFARNDFFRIRHYTPYLDQLKSKLSKLTPTKDLIEELENWINEITHKSDSNKILKEYWAFLRIDLIQFKKSIEESILNKIEEKQIEDENNNCLRIPLSDIADRYKTDLSQDEIILLFLYLRDLKLIDNVSDSALSMCMNVLSGNSYKQILKKMSGKAKTQKFLITDDQVKYDKLYTMLLNVTNKIKEDRAK